MIEENTTPREQRYLLSNIEQCINFWNREGREVYDDNRSDTGRLGNEETKTFAKATEFDDWLLAMMTIDANTFCKSDDNQRPEELKFESGRTRSHVWVHVNDDRKMMIYFDKSKQMLKFEA